MVCYTIFVRKPNVRLKMEIENRLLVYYGFVARVMMRDNLNIILKEKSWHNIKVNRAWLGSVFYISILL